MAAKHTSLNDSCNAVPEHSSVVSDDDIKCAAGYRVNSLPQRDTEIKVKASTITRLSVQVAKHEDELVTLRAANKELARTCETMQKRLEELERIVSTLTVKLVDPKVGACVKEPKDRKLSLPSDVLSVNSDYENSTIERFESTTSSLISVSMPSIPAALSLNNKTRSNIAKRPQEQAFDGDEYTYVTPHGVTRLEKQDRMTDCSYVQMKPSSHSLGRTPSYSTCLVMRKFTKHKVNGDRWISQPFFTHPQGYKMCLKVAANGQGSGKGTHITVGVYLMKGEFDGQLEWPFRGDITIQLSNQKGDGKHNFTRTIFQAMGSRVERHAGRTSSIINAWVINQFKRQNELRPMYLNDDSLKFRVYTDSNQSDPSIDELVTDL